MNQDIERYYQKIDIIIATIIDLAQQIIHESAKGELCDLEKISQYQGGLKFILGTKSAVEAIATLVKIQAKLAEIIASNPSSSRNTLPDEDQLQATYAYFVARYEDEHIYQEKKCSNCGAEQQFLENIASGQYGLTFEKFLEKITNNIKLKQ